MLMFKFRSSVFQPPGRVPVPGLGGLLTGTSTIFETFKCTKFSIDKISFFQFTQLEMQFKQNLHPLVFCSRKTRLKTQITVTKT